MRSEAKASGQRILDQLVCLIANRGFHSKKLIVGHCLSCHESFLVLHFKARAKDKTLHYLHARVPHHTKFCPYCGADFTKREWIK